MADPAPGDQFTVGPPKDYVGGHITIGLVMFLEAAIPVILYYTWQYSRLASISAANHWWECSWKAMTYGGFLAFIVPFFFWFTRIIQLEVHYFHLLFYFKKWCCTHSNKLDFGKETWIY